MRIIILMTVLLAGSNTSCFEVESYKPQNGDIVFHTSKSAQSQAIQLVTKSPYSHMGIVYLRNGEPMVFEAVEPVRSTPLQAWIERGKDRHFVAKRLQGADRILTPEALQRMADVAKGFEGKHYDLRFEWSDQKLYCSELVWKVYKRALDIEIGELEKFADFDLSDPAVQKKIRERWRGSDPSNQVVISPAAIFASKFLVTRYQQ